MSTATGLTLAEIAKDHGDLFCHVCGDADCLTLMCGFVSGGMPCHEEYDGEAVCEVCGKPTCPQCAVLYDLETRAES